MLAHAAEALFEEVADVQGGDEEAGEEGEGNEGEGGFAFEGGEGFDTQEDDVDYCHHSLKIRAHSC